MLVLVGIGAPGGANAQDSSLSYGKLNFEAGLELDTLRQQLRTEGAPSGNSEVRRFGELIGARSEGFWIGDPRLFTGNLGATFEVFQERDNNNGSTLSRHGTLTDYDFDAVILGAKPYWGKIYANQSETFFTLPFSGTTRLTLENAGGAVLLRQDSIVRDWGLPYFSASATANRQHINETTTTPGAPYRNDQIRDTVSVNAANGFLTSDLDLYYDYVDVVDRIVPRNSFTTEGAGANYSLDFGPDLNRRWDSRLHYYNRGGSGPLTTYDANEELHIDHYDNLSTDYRYLFIRSDQPSGTDTTNLGTFVVRHELNQNLTTRAELQGSGQRVPAGTLDWYAGQAEADYKRSLPFNGQLTAHALGRYQINDNHLTVPDINVIDEPHAAPTPIGGGAGFTLVHNFAITSTIVVVDTQGGGRQPTVAGVDYDIVTEGNRIQIIALASSNVIRAGDSLAVSYSYAVPPELKYRTTTWALGGTLDFRWITLSYLHDQSDQASLSGDIGAKLLQDWSRDDAGLELRGAWGTLDARAGFGYQRYDSTFLAYTQRLAFQNVTWQPGYDLVFGLTAAETRIDYSLPVRETETLAGGTTLDWYAPNGWWVTAFARTRRLQQTDFPTQTTSDAGVRARFAYGKIELSALVGASWTTQGTSRSNDQRFEIKLLRQF